MRHMNEYDLPPAELNRLLRHRRMVRCIVEFAVIGFVLGALIAFLR